MPPQWIWMVDLRCQLLASGNCSQDDKWFHPRGHYFRQGGVRPFMGEILLAGEETQERPALLCNLIADRTAQHGIPSLQGVENRALCDRAIDFKPYLGAD